MAQTSLPERILSLPNGYLHLRHEDFTVEALPDLLGGCSFKKQL
jgi:hypothetical protein